MYLFMYNKGEKKRMPSKQKEVTKMPIKVEEIHDKFGGGKPDKTTAVPIKNGTANIVSNSGGVKKITIAVTIKNDSSEDITRKYEYNSALKTLKIVDTPKIKHKRAPMSGSPLELAIPEEGIKKKFHALLMEASKKTTELSVGDIAKINIREVVYMQWK